MTEAARPTRMQSASWLGSQRLTLAPEALLTETRDPVTGVWSPGRSVFYDEIRAVYTYRAPDWPYLVAATLYGVLGGVLVLIAGLAAEWSRPTWAAAVGGLLVLVGLLAVFRVFVRQERFARLDTGSGGVVFSVRDAGFLEQLRGRLVEGGPMVVTEPAPNSPEGSERESGSGTWGQNAEVAASQAAVQEPQSQVGGDERGAGP